MDASFECFATKTSDGNVTEAYYAIWLDDNSVAAIAVGKKQQDELDKITDRTWAYINGEADSYTDTPFEGIVKVGEFEGDLHIMYTQDLADIGITSDDFLIRNVLFDYTEGRTLKHDFFMFLIFAIIGLVGLVVLLIGAGKEAQVERNTFPIEKQDLKVVSASQATHRITNADIKKCLSKLRIKAILWIAGTAALIIIPACMYAYTAYNNKTVEERKADYNLDEADYPATAKENETATITIESAPSLVCNEDGSSFYLIYSDMVYVGILDKASYDKAVKDIAENGEATLYGYLEIPTDTAKKSIIKYSGSTGSEYDYDDMFGKFALNVEAGYAGVGVPLEKIKTFYIAAGIFIICGLIFGWSAYKKYRYMVNGLRAFSDSEYAQIEREMASATTVRFPQNLFMTENYLVMLDTFSAYKDTTNAEDTTLIIRYKDITWMYPSNQTMYGQTTNMGITVCGPKFGRSVILGQPANNKGENNVVSAYDLLSEKCPNALKGYTEENKAKAQQFISNM